jgi:hypothetical protein
MSDPVLDATAMSLPTPTAQHELADVQLTDDKRLSSAGPGEATIDHDRPL